MKESKSAKQLILYGVGYVILCPAAVLLAGYLYGAQIRDLVRNGIFVAMLSLCVLFTLLYEYSKDKLLFDNGQKIWRFFLACLIFLAAVCVFPLLPPAGWPFLTVFVTLTLFSAPLTAFASGVQFLCMAMLLSGSTDITIFLTYVLPGVIGILLFSTVGEDFRVFVPIIVSTLSQLLTLSTFEVLLSDRVFTAGLFLYPIVNVIISVAVLLIVLKIFSFSLVYKEADRFMDIIDPEFELLTMLKNTSKEDYDHCVYTAVLCSKMANKMGLSENIVKALGYYHRIGVVRGENNWENARAVLAEYELPERIAELLSEYLNKNKTVRSREVGVLLFADTVISSITYLFSKDKNAQLNYDKLIGTIFDKKLESGVLLHSDVSFEDLNIMRETLIEEKLFYDFLR